jgi:NADH-quinone oxidoreductase subunit F
MRRIASFYQHESCGQCTPCRQGTGWLLAIVNMMCEGTATEGHVEMLYSAASNIEGNTICAFGDAAAWPIKSFLEKFPDEIRAEIAARRERSAQA